MANMASITVKKNDGATDITYTALTASAGDKVPARWKSNTASVIPNFRPELSMVSQYNGSKDVRRERILLTYPATVTVGGVEQKAGTHVFDLAVHLVQSVDSTTIDEAVAQFANLLKSTLIQSAMKEGYAPV